MENNKFKVGLSVREKVLGEKHVKNSMSSVSEFNKDIQELTTEYCWGTIWTREGLTLKQRSMINLAMLSALNRPNELKVHIKGALNNGVTRAEIKEIFLQVAIYCGLPAALESFRLGEQILLEKEQE